MFLIKALKIMYHAMEKIALISNFALMNILKVNNNKKKFQSVLVTVLDQTLIFLDQIFSDLDATLTLTNVPAFSY